MFSVICFALLCSIASSNCTKIPFIQNVTLFPRYTWNSTTITNRTYQQCLCMAIPDFVILNYFPNKTCQLFYTFPISYKIQSTPQARLYFPQKIFPNASQCCMPNLAYLLDKLKNGTWTYVNVSTPRNLLIDNNGYLVTVEMQPPKLDRFDPFNLTKISQTPISGSYAMAVAFANNAYFVGLINGPIVVIQSRNLTVLSNISSYYIQGIRGIIFLDNENTMVCSSNSNQTMVFFHQTSSALFNYTFAYKQSVHYPGVHGLSGHNDTYFYATSWNNNLVYSYSAIENSTSWIEALVVDATPFRNISGGTFVTIDECGRYWFSLETSVLQIFDSLGSWIGNFSLGSGWIMDTLIADNYVMYFSDRSTNGSRIIRIDPHILC